MAQTLSLDNMRLEDFDEFSLKSFDEFILSLITCPSGQLPATFVSILVKPVADPSHEWKNFNDVWRLYRRLKMEVESDLFCKDALPEAPNPVDFSA